MAHAIPDWSIVAGGRRGRNSHRLTLHAAAREYCWLYDSRAGVSDREIARREGVTIGRVRFGLSRAAQIDASPSSLAELAERTAARRLVPLFPVGLFTPMSACPHAGPIDPQSRLICMICHNRSATDRAEPV